jgi:hypothetical protein
MDSRRFPCFESPPTACLGGRRFLKAWASASKTNDLSPAMCLGMLRGEEILGLSSFSRIDLEKTDNESAT